MSLKCPFSTPLITGDFQCHLAQEVVRRGGSEYDCTQLASHGRCSRVLGTLKASALPAFGVEDDPLTMPHSVLVKIQLGGLRGLQRLLGHKENGPPDADVLLCAAAVQFGGDEGLPVGNLVQDIVDTKLARRRTR